MLVAVRQRRFDGGEIDEGLSGRNDIDQFDRSLAEMRNFFPTRRGAAVSRPGMKHCGYTKNRTTTAPRLIPFKLSDDLSYVLEFGAAYVRFWRDGELQLSGVAAYELATPYTISAVRRLKFTPLGSSLLVTHPDYAPRELVLVDESPIQWTISEVDFDLPAYGGAPPMLVEPFFTDSLPDFPKREWSFQVTEVVRRPDGTVYESLPAPVLQSVLFDAFAGATVLDRARIRSLTTNKWPIYPSKPMEITFDLAVYGVTPSDTLPWTRGVIEAQRVYRGRGKLMGLVAEVVGKPIGTTDVEAQSEAPGATSESVGAGPGRAIDYGADPDYTHSPPQGRNPFKVYDPVDAETLLRTEAPAVCCYFQQRLVFGRTDERPNWLWCSAVNNFTDFDEYVEPLDEDAFERQLASLSYEEIRALVPRERLFIFTNDAVWSMAGSGGEPLSPVGLVSLQRESPVGSTLLDPIELPSTVLYERAMGGGVRDLAFSHERGGYHSGDLSFLAGHLFDGHSLVAWGYAEVPWGLIWAARDDGKLISLLYDRERGIVAWSLHETDGWIEDLCVVPEGDEHAVYLLVRRLGTLGTSVRYSIERMTDRLEDDPELVVCLDAAVSFDAGEGLTYPAGTLAAGAAATHLIGESVTIVADGAKYGPVLLFDTDIPLEVDARHVHVGLAYTPRIKTLPLAAAMLKNKLVKRVTIETEKSRGIWVGEEVVGSEAEKPLEEWKERAVSENFDAISLKTERVGPFHPTSTWNRYGRVIVEQRSPFPLTIVGITREYEDGKGGDDR
jgi:hypothetical protein